MKGIPGLKNDLLYLRLEGREKNFRYATYKEFKLLLGYFGFLVFTGP